MSSIEGLGSVFSSQVNQAEVEHQQNTWVNKFYSLSYHFQLYSWHNPSHDRHTVELTNTMCHHTSIADSYSLQLYDDFLPSAIA